MAESVQAKPARRQGLRAIGAAMPAITKTSLMKRGFAAARVIAAWPDIVGPLLSSCSIPERLVKDRAGTEPTLLVKVAPGAALELQHLEPLVIERINTHFGFRAVARLKLKQGPVTRLAAPATPRRKPVDPAVEKDLERRLTGIADPGIQSALLALGRVVAQRK
jgi:hypothetical protein